MRIDSAASSSVSRSLAGYSAERTAHGTGTVVLDMGSLAQRVGLSSAALGSWFDTGGRLTLTAGASGLRSSVAGGAIDGLPAGPGGGPDFDALVAAGWKVRGAIPPNGDASMTMITQYGSTTYWAAEVEPPGGAAFYTRGASLNLEPGAGQRAGLAFLASALDGLDALPRSYADAIARRDENWLGRTSDGSRLDRTI